MGWWRRWRRRADPETQRARLVDEKHRLEGEIRQLQSETRKLRARGEDTSAVEARIADLQSRHYRLRLEIDRTR